MSKTRSSLSMKRIIISLILFALIPVCAKLLNRYIGVYDLSLMLSMNILTSLLIIYDWNLVGIHYNRAKANIPDSILYFLVGTAGIFLWTKAGTSLLKISLIIPSPETFKRYTYAIPVLLAAFSFIESSLVNISFKCITDHLDVRSREIQAIMISGLLFGLVLTIAFMPEPFSIGLLSRTYLYNLVLVAFLSYLYNQSSNFIPGILSMGTVYLYIMITML